jgi:hypothetical protein
VNIDSPARPDLSPGSLLTASSNGGAEYPRRMASDDGPNKLQQLVELHWRASESGDYVEEHSMYAEQAILDYPQSGERFRGRDVISAQRRENGTDRHFTVQRIVGDGQLWVSECVITYDGVPTLTISVMEFLDDAIIHETQYFADGFDAPASRAELAEPIP